MDGGLVHDEGGGAEIHAQFAGEPSGRQLAGLSDQGFADKILSLAAATTKQESDK